MAKRITTQSRFELDETDRQILKLKIEYPDITDTEIAKAVGLTRQHVNKRRLRPAFQNAIAEYLMPAKTRIQNLVDKAARKYQKLLDSHDEKVVRNVAKDILISENKLRNRVDVDVTQHEPLIIKKSREVIEVHPGKPKQIGKREKE